MEIETRRVRKSTDSYLAMYVTEMFPEVLTGPFQGSLVIEHDYRQPRGFAVGALFDRGGLFSAVQVTPIDDERQWEVLLEPLWSEEEAETIPVDEREAMWITTMETLATTYGFEIYGRLKGEWKNALFLLIEPRAVAVMTEEVSKAVRRDSLGPTCPSQEFQLGPRNISGASAPSLRNKC